MDVHKNARLTPGGREVMVRRVVDGGAPIGEVAAAMGVCEKTVRKWRARFAVEGIGGLVDRSSRPHRLHRLTPPSVVARIEALRRERWNGKQIAAACGVSGATVSRVLRRLGLNRLQALQPAEPILRYERQRPGELLHLDIKKLGRFNAVGYRITGDQSRRTRGVGWDFVHVCIDDASRIAFVEIRSDERKETVIAFLQNALAYYAKLGMQVEAIMTDNGGAYRSAVFAKACRQLGLRHIFTRPYRPRTNGKAERFIQTALREWAYARAYENSRQRTDELPLWLHRYNWHRPHSALQAKPPISRLGFHHDNLLTLHS